MELYSAGTVTTGNSATVTDRTAAWKVMATSAVSVTVKFYGSSDGTGPGITITIPSTNTGFVEVPGDFQKITVTGGTVSYMVFV